MKPRIRPLLIALLLVLSGGVVTLFIEHKIVRRQAPASPAALHASILTQMDSTLRLTRVQHDSLHAIFVRHQSGVDSAWRSINQRMQGTMDSVHREIQRVLEPGQVAAFHEWMRRQHRRHESRHQKL